MSDFTLEKMCQSCHTAYCIIYTIMDRFQNAVYGFFCDETDNMVIEYKINMGSCTLLSINIIINSSDPTPSLNNNSKKKGEKGFLGVQIQFLA